MEKMKVLQSFKQGCACSLGSNPLLKAGLSCSCFGCRQRASAGHGHCRLQDVEEIDQFGGVRGVHKDVLLEPHIPLAEAVLIVLRSLVPKRGSSESKWRQEPEGPMGSPAVVR